MTDKSQVTVVATKSHPMWLSMRNVLIAVVVLAMVGAGVWWFVFRSTDDSAANAAHQKVLQQSLQASLAKATDPAGVVDASTKLINGVKDHTFKLSNPDLSLIYLQRATAYVMLKQYRQAVADYEAAVPLDATSKKAALQGEVQARYSLGNRKQLIPLYQQLIGIMKSQQDSNPLANNYISQYQGAITALQNGQELPNP